MSADPILDELHAVRDAIAEEFGNDVHTLFEYLRERDRQHGKTVTLEPNPPRRPALSREN